MHIYRTNCAHHRCRYNQENSIMLNCVDLNCNHARIMHVPPVASTFAHRTRCPRPFSRKRSSTHPCRCVQCTDRLNQCANRTPSGYIEQRLTREYACFTIPRVHTQAPTSCSNTPHSFTDHAAKLVEATNNRRPLQRITRPTVNIASVVRILSRIVQAHTAGITTSRNATYATMLSRRYACVHFHISPN